MPRIEMRWIGAVLLAATLAAGGVPAAAEEGIEVGPRGAYSIGTAPSASL